MWKQRGKNGTWKSGFQALEIGIIPMQTIFWWEPKRQRRRFDLKIVQKFFLELLVIKLWTAIFRKVKSSKKYHQKSYKKNCKTHGVWKSHKSLIQHCERSELRLHF